MSLRSELKTIKDMIPRSKSVPQQMTGKVHLPSNNFIPFIVVKAKNMTGNTIVAGTIVNLSDGDIDVPYFYFAAADNDPEISIYGVVMDDSVIDRDYAYVQLSGEATVRIKQNNTLIITGDKVYALANEDGSRGLVTSKGTNDVNIISDALIGRSLQAEDPDSDTIQVNLSVNSVGGGGNVAVERATNANITVVSSYTINTIILNSIPSIDGAIPTNNSLVLIKNQTPTGTNGKRNGIYRVNTVVDPITGKYIWTRTGSLTSGMLISVRGGTRNSGTVYVLTNAAGFVIGTTALTFTNKNYIEFANVVAADATAGNSMDGVTVAATRLVLQLSGVIGVYYYDGSSFIYDGTPTSVMVRPGGAANGNLLFVLNAAGNAYVMSNAVWG